MPGMHGFGAVTMLSTLVALVCALLHASRRLLQALRGRPLPPGPTGLPVLGSFPFLGARPELTMHAWAQMFGALYAVWLGNQLCVVVSDPGAAHDLLVAHAPMLSSRKDMFMQSNIILDHRGITASGHDETWHKHRRLASQFLSARAVAAYAPRLQGEVAEMLRELCVQGQAGARPLDPRLHASRAVLNSVLTLVFGVRAGSADHPLVGRWLRLSQEFMDCTGPVSNWVDFVPALRYFPRWTMINRGKKLHKALVDTCDDLITDVQRRMKAGEAVPECLAKFLLTVKEQEELDWWDVAFICCAFMLGGVNTTAAVVQWFVAEISAHPEMQARAQAELDSVVGRDRLPTAADERSLPYTRAIIKEIERMHNPRWLGTPHLCTEDVKYRGRVIPKDTAVILNTYTMHKDPARFPDPERFDPERYVDDKYTASESARLADPYQRDNWMFGAGRRICPGIPLAEEQIFLAVVSMLWAFKIEQVPGMPVDLKGYEGGVSCRSPAPFHVTMTPRHRLVTGLLGLN